MLQTINSVFIVVSLFVCVSLSGCNTDNNPNGPDNVSISDTLVIGIAGGEFTTSDGGITIIVEFGKLNSDATLVISSQSTFPGFLPGTCYSFELDGQDSFDLPCKLRFYFDETLIPGNTVASALSVCKYDGENWYLVGGAVWDGYNYIEVYLSQFSPLGVRPMAYGNIYSEYLGYTITSQELVEQFGANHYTGITSGLHISGDDITSLEPLQDLQWIGSMQISECPNLVNLQGLQNVEAIGSVIIAQMDQLQNLEGLTSLSSIGGYLNFSTLHNFHDFQGTSLTSIGGVVLAGVGIENFYGF
ncbi:hypothetical protein KKA00_03350, partial [bacterium]|nr:hypothetical protein [bacterium]